MTKYFGSDFIAADADGMGQGEELSAGFIKNFSYEIVSVEAEGDAAQQS